FPLTPFQRERVSLSSNIKHLIGAKMENPYSSSSSSSSENLLQNLNTRGWCFRDVNLVNSLIESQLPSPYTVDSIESELLNMDLRSIGGKSLPDFSLLRKSTHLQGPKVLQVIIFFFKKICLYIIL
ncbi:hypothetical protein HAX54_046073, partial [Datura stramonium]|nr:hypothetical protein [Datura stramonium]